MTHKTASRVKETSATTGTGAYTLAGAAAGYRAFSDQITPGAKVYVPYYAFDSAGNYESGIGELTTATNLNRTAVIQSSNANAAVNWANPITLLVAPPALGVTAGRHNFAAGAAPTASDNYTAGYAIGSLWSLGTANSPIYACISPGDSDFPSAVWAPMAHAYAITFAKTAAGAFYPGATVVGDDGAIWDGRVSTYAAFAAGGYGARFYHTFGIIENADDPTNNYTTTGASQRMRLAVVGQTANATPTVLYIQNDSTDGNLYIPPSCAQEVKVRVIARQPSTGDAKSWTLEQFHTRGAGTANPALVGSLSKTTNAASAGAAAWDVTIQFNNTSKTFEIKVTGEAGKTISWAAFVDVYHNGDGE